MGGRVGATCFARASRSVGNKRLTSTVALARAFNLIGCARGRNAIPSREGSAGQRSARSISGRPGQVGQVGERQ